eukprot:g14613.t1
MDDEVSLEFMTGNPQLGVLSGRLTYLQSSSGGTDQRRSPSPENTSSTSQQPGANNIKFNTAAPWGSKVDIPDQRLPDRRSKLLCILSVPAHMVPTDMLHFAAPFKEQVHSIRILRPCNPVGPSDPARTPAEYMVLLQMEDQPSADDFFLQCNGKCFNSFEESFCRVVFVATATFDIASPASSPSPTSARAGHGASTIPSPAFDASTTPTGGGGGNVSAATTPPPPLRAALRFSPISGGGSGGGGHGGGGVVGAGGAAAVAGGGCGVGGGLLSPDKVAGAAWEYDASTCVICMDRMESRVLTTVCNHSFHVECLVKWQDSPCPVCRFHHNNASEASTCQECQATDNLWVCLICGSVLCGSRHEDHIRGHYTNTLHAYAIEIETQQVWDFAGDGFVHRLIHNKADGKLVEVSDPGQTSEERPQMPARLSDIQEERLVHGKLEGLAYQYNTLLTSQLDEQRHFYQKQLNGLLEEQEKSRRERNARMVSGADLVSALRQQKRELESKCTSASARLRRIREETGFLWELNRSLEANKPQVLANLEQAQRDLDAARKAREEWVPTLEKKVAALMLKLDAGVAAAAAGGLTPARAGPATNGSVAITRGNEGGGGGGGGGGNDSSSGQHSSGQHSSGGLASDGDASSACSAANEFGAVTQTPSVTGRRGAAVAIPDGQSGGGGGAEETKEAGGTVDDDRGGERRRGSSPLSGAAGGGSSNSSSGGSSGKKKGRRRKSK